MPDPLLSLEGVALEAPGGRRVFQGLDWRLEKGSRFVLQAGLGTGATALLRLCAGLAKPGRGRVLLAGVAPDPDALAHPFINTGALGWVPTDGGLAVNLTYLQNAALPLRFARRTGREEAEAVAGLWLERAGLGAVPHQRPRVPADRDAWLASLARAGAKGAQLWLVDRPPGALDAASVRAARAILEQAGQDPDVTFLLVGGDWMAGLGETLRIEEGRLASGSRP